MNTRLPRSTLPALAVFGLCLLTGAIGYFTAPVERPAPPALFTDAAPQDGPDLVSGRVVSFDASADTLVIETSDGEVSYQLASQPAYEHLQESDRPAIRPGDWVNASVNNDLQGVLRLSGLVVIPAERLASP